MAVTLGVREGAADDGGCKHHGPLDGVPIYLCVYLSIYLSIYLPIYGPLDGVPGFRPLAIAFISNCLPIAYVSLPLCAEGMVR